MSSGYRPFSLRDLHGRRDRLHVPWAYSLVGVGELPVSGAAHPLQREEPKWVGVAGVTALLLGLLCSLLWQARVREGVVTATSDPVRTAATIGVPPSIAGPAPRHENVGEVATPPPDFGAPVPVPDEYATQPTLPTLPEIGRMLADKTQGPLLPGERLVLDPAPDRPAAPAPAANAAPLEQLPVRLSCAAPVYPAMARQAGVEGTVRLHVKVGKDGRVLDVRFVDGPAMLRESAIASARSAVFRPATSNGMPAEVWVAFPVVFTLRGAGAR